MVGDRIGRIAAHAGLAHGRRIASAAVDGEVDRDPGDPRLPPVEPAYLAPPGESPRECLHGNVFGLGAVVDDAHDGTGDHRKQPVEQLVEALVGRVHHPFNDWAVTIAYTRSGSRKRRVVPPVDLNGSHRQARPLRELRRDEALD
jgi:hypothetical protein